MLKIEFFCRVKQSVMGCKPVEPLGA